MLDKVDVDGDGFIDFDEFKNSNMMHGEFDGVSAQDKSLIHSKFHGWDTDKDGLATHDEIAEVGGDSLAWAVMKEVDEDKDNAISYDDLQDFYDGL